MMERNAKKDAMALAYLAGLMAHRLEVEAVASPELARHGLIVLFETLETLAQGAGHEHEF